MKYIMNKAPIGWNSYTIMILPWREADIKANADIKAAHLEDAREEYIVADIQRYSKDAGTLRDQYQYIPYGDMEMDDFGKLQPAQNRFPFSAGGKCIKFLIFIFMRGILREAAYKHFPIWGQK